MFGDLPFGGVAFGGVDGQVSSRVGTVTAARPTSAATVSAGTRLAATVTGG